MKSRKNLRKPSWKITWRRNQNHGAVHSGSKPLVRAALQGRNFYAESPTILLVHSRAIWKRPAIRLWVMPLIWSN